MWDEKPEHCKATGLSRPIRVAYLVNLDECPDILLDAIFDESYSRWGGRRTAIVPANESGIDQRYSEWLHFFDADIIYSFVPLSDGAVESLHEQYAPALLTEHVIYRAEVEDPSNYRIALPITALSSLSVLPAFLSRPGPFSPIAKNAQILDTFSSQATYPFLRENFGLLGISFQPTFALAHSDLLAPLTLISPADHENGRLMKNPSAIYVHEEQDVIDALAERNRPLLTLANLSEMFAPYLSGFDNGVNNGLTIVVGSTAKDRVAFWNGLHSRDRTRPYQISHLRIPEERFDDADFLKGLCRVLRLRGWGNSNRSDSVSLESCSVDEKRLRAMANALRQAGSFHSASVRNLTDPSEVIPSFPRNRGAYFTNGSVFEEPEARASMDFRGRHFAVPMVPPWHLTESLPPSQMRNGSWMVDLSIEREVDHSRFSNVRHIWMLPRRIRIERAFSLDIDKKQRNAAANDLLRPSRLGELSFSANLDQRSVKLTLPEDDLSAMRLGVQNDFEWRQFNSAKKDSPHARLRFEWSDISDKGKYLLGVLQMFDDVPTAFRVLMDSFWREEFQLFGASLLEKRADLPSRVVQTLRNRLGQRMGPLRLETEAQLQRLGQIALTVAAELRAETVSRTYSNLRTHWEKMTSDWLVSMPLGDENITDEERARDDAYYRDPYLLDRSVQYLCERNVLFQGYGWTCKSCYNKNWVGVEAFGKTIKCVICRTNRAAPVSEEWHFKPNGFFIDAYRLHGTEPVVWSLWRLFEEARSSFYFAPSLRLWKNYPRNETNKHWDVEIDALAVADGQLYAIEATRSKDLDDEELKKLQLMAERIRPDTLIVTCTANSDSAAAKLHRRLIEKMPVGVAVRVEIFRPEDLHTSPNLPP
ncbi:hypothetical protein [Rhizobium sp. BR 249]|uniref:hypothetical protein n=1 Tax=Rhizobium sp. BR 249 TaxID=3040011 RepID=UPI0039BEEDA1